MNNNYSISIRKLPAESKIYEENYASWNDYMNAVRAASVQVFFRMELVDENSRTRRGLDSPSVDKDKWEYGLRMSTQAIYQSILQHEGIPEKSIGT